MRAARAVVIGLMVCGVCGRSPAQENAAAGGATNGPPRWEAGVGGVAARMPLYRGSDEYREYAIPLPYFIYRGTYVQVEREGIRGLFYRSRRIETDLSLGGNPPVGNDAVARQGMPDLDPLMEIGPAVRAFLYRGERVRSVYVEGAARGVVSVDRGDFGLAYEGNRVGISLVAPSCVVRPGSPWILGGRIGADFGDQDYHAYFYDVKEDETAPGREAYHSRGGYGGCFAAGHVTRRIRPGLSVSMYVQCADVEGAVYEDSPLVKARVNWIAGAAMVWRLAESRARAERR